MVFNTYKQNFSLYMKMIFLIQLLYLSTDVGLSEEMTHGSVFAPLREGRFHLLFAVRM